METVENYALTSNVSTLLMRYIDLLEMLYGREIDETLLLSNAVKNMIIGNLETLQRHTPTNYVIVGRDGNVSFLDADESDLVKINELRESAKF